MTAPITTTCATSRPVGPDTARAARGASGNCAPTGRCLAATSAKSHRSSSTASASGASASCSPGRALASPARRCVPARPLRSGEPRERERRGPPPWSPTIRPGHSRPFGSGPALASRRWAPLARSLSPDCSWNGGRG